MTDYDNGFLSEFQDEVDAAFQLLQEATATGDEAEIAGAWDLYEAAAAVLETARDLAAQEWGWDDNSDDIRISDEERFGQEDTRITGGLEFDPFIAEDPAQYPGAELRGEPFAFAEDALAYVADIAGTAQTYFGIYENEARAFEVWYAPERA